MISTWRVCWFSRMHFLSIHKSSILWIFIPHDWLSPPLFELDASVLFIHRGIIQVDHIVCIAPDKSLQMHQWVALLVSADWQAESLFLIRLLLVFLVDTTTDVVGRLVNLSPILDIYCT